MDEWMTSFLSQESFSTAKQKEDATKAFSDFETFDDKELYQNVEQFKAVCRRIDDCAAKAQISIVNKDRVLVLEPFYGKLLEFTVNVALVSADIHAFLRDDTNLLVTLTSHLNDKYQDHDQAKILKTIEVLSRGINVTWSLPYLHHLIKQTFKVLLAPKTSAENYLYGLRIITNLIFHNQNCLNIVLREVTYRDVLKRVMSLMSDKNSSHELVAMALNFCYLTDQAISMRLSTQINNIRNAFGEIQRKIETENFKDAHGVAATIHYITLCVSTALTRCVKDNHDIAIENSQDNEKEGTNAVKKVVEEISGIIFSKFFTKLFPLLRTNKGQIVVASLLNLLKALCPNDIPTEEYENHWESFSKSLNELGMVACSKSVTQIPVLETHLHFVDRILQSQTKNALSADSFQYALNNCQIVLSSHPIDLSRNIATIRLLNRLNALAGLQKEQNRRGGSDSVSNKLSKLLNEESLAKLLSELLSEKTDNYASQPPCIQTSACVVEIVNVFAKLSKNTTKLIEVLENEKTWFHMSNCIVNGNEELISQALALLGAVGFSAKCRAGVSRTLMEIRATARSPLKSPVLSPERLAYPTACATMGMKKLNDNLEMFQQHHVVENGTAVDDVLAWYKLKTDMHELELSNMNEHIFQLNRTNNQLKILLDKQSELVAQRAVSSATMKKEYTDLQKQLEVTKEKKADLETKHAKAIQSLRLQLSYQEELYKVKCDRLSILEKESKELKETCAEMKTGRDEAIEDARRVTVEKRKIQEKLDEVEKNFKTSRQKLTTFETNLKKSEEARKTAEAQLEAERRKTEIIQQVLGNRLS